MQCNNGMTVMKGVK